MATMPWKQNDTGWTEPINLRYGDGTAPNLEGVTSVKFLMRDSRGTVVRNGDAVPVAPAATSGAVRYNRVAADTATVGIYFAEIQVVFADSSRRTFPEAEELLVSVRKHIAD